MFDEGDFVTLGLREAEETVCGDVEIGVLINEQHGDVVSHACFLDEHCGRLAPDASNAVLEVYILAVGGVLALWGSAVKSGFIEPEIAGASVNYNIHSLIVYPKRRGVEDLLQVE